MKSLELLIDGKHLLGECVIWCDRSHCILWTDIEASTLWIHSPANGVTRHYAMPERLASFALTNDDDRLLLGLASRLAYFNLSSGAITPICDVEPELAATRINDGRCDRQGRFVFGTVNQAEGHAPIGSFYRLNTDMSLERLPLDYVGIANGICFSVDGRTMYYCDSPTKKILCSNYDPVTGAISGERIFADLTGGAGVPDGAIVDAQGNLWSALWGGARVVRIAPDGTVDCQHTLPVSQPSCVTLGGPNLDQLYVTTARESMSDVALREEPTAGGIFHGHADGMIGLPPSRFGGRAIVGEGMDNV